jgi:hypothetical protein
MGKLKQDGERKVNTRHATAFSLRRRLRETGPAAGFVAICRNRCDAVSVETSVQRSNNEINTLYENSTNAMQKHCLGRQENNFYVTNYDASNLQRRDNALTPGPLIPH